MQKLIFVSQKKLASLDSSLKSPVSVCTGIVTFLYFFFYFGRLSSFYSAQFKEKVLGAPSQGKGDEDLSEMMG